MVCDRAVLGFCRRGMERNSGRLSLVGRGAFPHLYKPRGEPETKHQREPDRGGGNLVFAHAFVFQGSGSRAISCMLLIILVAVVGAQKGGDPDRPARHGSCKQGGP